MTQGWVKVYYRDENKVMRAIPEIKFLPGKELFYLAKSVYTIDQVSTKKTNKIWIRSKEKYFE